MINKILGYCLKRDFRYKIGDWVTINVSESGDPDYMVPGIITTRRRFNRRPSYTIQWLFREITEGDGWGWYGHDMLKSYE